GDGSLGESVDSGEAAGVGEVFDYGSTFVKYGDVLLSRYHGGAASSFFNPSPRGLIVQYSTTLCGFSRVNTIVSPLGSKIGATSWPELSFVNWRNNFPSSRYRYRWE